METNSSWLKEKNNLLKWFQVAHRSSGKPGEPDLEWYEQGRPVFPPET